MLTSQPDFKSFIFLLAHGAGADMNSDWMVDLSRYLNEKGLEVVRFNFPYMVKRGLDGKKRPPDRMPKLIEAYQEQLGTIPPDKRIIIGGKSMGGRVASLLAIEPDLPRRLTGLICLGFPFHPPAKIDKYRGQHLESIALDTLILQGERDLFGTREQVADYQLSKNIQVEYLADGDHSFKPRVRSGHTMDSNMLQASELIVAFIQSLSQSRQ
jgi:uncharacterized protein